MTSACPCPCPSPFLRRPPRWLWRSRLCPSGSMRLLLWWGRCHSPKESANIITIAITTAAIRLPRPGRRQTREAGC